jgi:hypothetical protein
VARPCTAGEEQVLTLWRQQRQDAGQFVSKTQVEQPVGFVQHQMLDVAELERVVVHQIQQTARRGHHHVGTTAQAHHLRVDRDAAEHHGHLQRMRLGRCQVVGQPAQDFAHLGGQFARGHQDERAHPPRRGGWRLLQALQQGQGEGGGLAGAGLGRAQDISAMQDGRNGLLLDGRGSRETQLARGADEGG